MGCSCDGLAAAVAGCYLGSPPPVCLSVSLCGGADEFLSLKPTINTKYNLGIKVHFPFHPQLPSVSFGAPGIPDRFSFF